MKTHVNGPLDTFCDNFQFHMYYHGTILYTFLFLSTLERYNAQNNLTFLTRIYLFASSYYLNI